MSGKVRRVAFIGGPKDGAVEEHWIEPSYLELHFPRWTTPQIDIYATPPLWEPLPIDRYRRNGKRYSDGTLIFEWIPK